MATEVKHPNPAPARAVAAAHAADSSSSEAPTIEPRVASTFTITAGGTTVQVVGPPTLVTVTMNQLRTIVTCLYNDGSVVTLTGTAASDAIAGFTLLNQLGVSLITH